MSNETQHLKEPEAPPVSEYLTEKDAAAYLGVAPATLRDSRYRGRILGTDNAPTWYRVGNRVRYRRADLAAWLESNAVEKGQTLSKPAPPSRIAQA